MSHHANGRAELRVGAAVRTVLAAMVLVAVAVVPGRAQTAQNVAVVINDASPDSVRVGEYYVKARAIPATNVIHIRTETDDTIERAAYLRTIEAPVANALARQRLHDQVLYLVLTKGLPLRIGGTVGPRGTMSSVDSELTLLYRKLAGVVIRPENALPNPYYLGDRALTDARRFSHREHDIYLVSRLDAYTVDEAIRLVDKAMTPATTGKVVLDQRDALTNRLPETWLESAARRLGAMGQGANVVLETTTKPARDVSQVLGYYSWGSTDPQNRVRDAGMGFAPGALAGTLVATGARTFREPPPAWVPSGDLTTRTSWFAGSPESLVGDLIREGATGVVGYVGEPSVAGLVRPEILFPAYLSGFNLIEAFYLATPHLGWQTVVVGDPLCSPVKKEGLSRADTDPPLDDVTQLPQHFSARRLALAVSLSPGIPERAVALTLRSEVMATRGDIQGAIRSTDEAIQIAPRYVPALTLSATIDEGAGRRDEALEKYKRILDVQPNNPVALNNYAYGLAVFRKSPAEALPFAQRAATQAPDNPSILDTLAWVQYLAGDSANAAKTMARLLRGNPGEADIRLRAATIYAASGARAVAESELATALRLRPSLAGSDEVKRLREQIAKLAAN